MVKVKVYTIYNSHMHVPEARIIAQNIITQQTYDCFYSHVIRS